ncbi:hypothetical protein [Azospira inquinata]|uniref:Agglutinin biogenesis protein MshP n=1 Tax=Azospira inquinata TaxID=2785627 RepID=A0A975SP13_9RHOO|nr:hypothetical protein [Azospira inquinata]QWT47463.1 hypothetical protein J8L76_07145 [Azospira inquinata]QWT49914.1 agglutinin biogenesis protein MshP [Azospira inquinata]
MSTPRKVLLQKRSAGFAIATALFILVVLAAIAAAMVNLFSGENARLGMEAQGSQAYQAARAGIEWGLYRQSINGSCVATPQSFSPAAPTLSGFTVSVTCTAAVSNPVVYSIVAVACNQPTNGACPNTTNPGAGYIERRIEVTL